MSSDENINQSKGPNLAMNIKSPASQNWKKVSHDLPLSHFNTLFFSHTEEEKIHPLFFWKHKTSLMCKTCNMKRNKHKVITL
jgi:hypothetical protein